MDATSFSEHARAVIVPEKTLADLEWPRLLEHLARRCSSEAAADAARSLPFLPEEDAWRRVGLVAEIQACFERGDPPPALPSSQIREWLSLVRTDAALPAEGLRDIATNLRLYVALARYFDARRDVAPGNAALVVPPEGTRDLVPLARVASEIESAFEPDGTLSDTASEDLGRLRRRASGLRQALLARIERIAESEEDILQERTITLRGDRFVLPVRADAHRRLKGIVHGASGSGATIFVEPDEIVSQGNDLVLAREDIAREEHRILASLRESVRDVLDEVIRADGILVQTEVRISAARLAMDLGANVPERATPGVIHLVAARHPLLVLDGANVVPSSLEIGPGRCLVVSGPNAGGKTVVLKTVGICCLMLAAGLPIPAGPTSRLGAPLGVLSDIGDDQDLAKSLSTYSAHMTNIASILAAARTGCIVLLDELAAGTDPVEGAALAEALLEDLNRRGATTLATTHFHALKARAGTDDGFSNAAMGFDMERMRPTFEIRCGSAGISSAIAVAGGFGIPAATLERARTLLPAGHRDLSRLLEDLEREKRGVAIERMRLAEERRAAEATARRHKEEIARLRAQQEKIIDAEARALIASIREAREKVREAERSLRRRTTDPGVVRRAKDLVNAADDTSEKLLSIGTMPGKPAAESDLVAGREVFVTTLRGRGIVESAPRNGKLIVRVGGAKARVAVQEVRILDTKQAVARGRRLGQPHADEEGIAEDGPAMRVSDNTADLRGLLAEEAVNAADAFLDDALRRDVSPVFLLHGVGTGSLMKAVRSYLATSPYVERFRPGTRDEGGDGVTVVWLK